eukprot:TRINITY_DN10263_c0_g1_i3.p1 TRINITY_DN10263_c0_g1~~TRINITY_DN10263_c0_g1_i3.p1  ORF type:complete len:426 (-),score=95.75 TRINITY_DN10263_c0_g1_i3:799-2076(-)
MKEQMKARLTVGQVRQLQPFFSESYRERNVSGGPQQQEVKAVSGRWREWRQWSRVTRAKANEQLERQAQLQAEHRALMAKQQQYVHEKPHTTHLELYDEMPMTLDLDEKPAVMVPPKTLPNGSLMPDMRNYYSLIGCEQNVKQRHLPGAFTVFHRRFKPDKIDNLAVSDQQKGELRQRYREYAALARKAAGCLLDEGQRAQYDEDQDQLGSQRVLLGLPRWMQGLEGLRKESWSWCWESLWKPGLPDGRKLHVDVTETVMITKGVPSRWFFTSKDGYVKTKLSDSLKPDKVAAQFKLWHPGTIKGIHRLPEGDEMGATLMTSERLDAVVLKRFLPATAVQRYYEPVNGMYRTTLTKKQGLTEVKVHTDMISLIGCDIKNGGEHAICEETTRSVVVDSRFKEFSIAIADQIQVLCCLHVARDADRM